MKTSIILQLSTLILLGLTGCSSARNVKIVEHATHDTVYLNHVQYDSVYVWNNLIQEYHPSLNPNPSTLIRVDTVYLERTRIEYKYKMLRDTIRSVRIDSIPVIHTVEVTKTVKAVPAIYKWSLGILIVLIIIIVAITVIRIIINYRLSKI